MPDTARREGAQVRKNERLDNMRGSEVEIPEVLRIFVLLPCAEHRL